jgi:nucleoside-diphosphate-sugar epimerase
MLIDELTPLATRRKSSLFAEDVQHRRGEIEDRVGGKRFLVIGGAGSIGSATIRALSAHRPRSIHVVDHNENGLAELVRDLRSREEGLDVPDFRTLPLDFGSPIMARYLADESPYDGVLNFAAIKHVRSEKDAYSLLQMLDTNILKPARLLRWLGERNAASRYFCVSTDKAANPVSLMGASKRLMEHVAFCGQVGGGLAARVTSARFANVAFSDGSLLQGFLARLEKRQPLAAPVDVRRYFISLEEAGQLCLLAAVCAPPSHLLVPRLDPDADLHTLDSIAVAVLRHLHLEPAIYREEAEARANVAGDLAAHRYPLLLTAPDTAGEKPYEEFVGAGESTVDVGMPHLLAVPYLARPAEVVVEFLGRMERLVADPDRGTQKDEIIAEMCRVIPELHHADRGKSLDQRM